jgi:hypothetical protein
MSRRRQFIVGLILSTFIAGFFAIFLSLWQVVPSWVIGSWSLRTQYALTPITVRGELLQRYHRALDTRFSHPFDPFLLARLRHPEVSSEERAAIICFYARRVAWKRAADEFFTLGREWIGVVLDATREAEGDVKHGAVLLMEGLLRGRQLSKPVIHAAGDGPAAGMSREDAALLAYVAFHVWWSLPAEHRAVRDPLDGTGIVISEP